MIRVCNASSTQQLPTYSIRPTYNERRVVVDPFLHKLRDRMSIMSIEINSDFLQPLQGWLPKTMQTCRYKGTITITAESRAYT